ncbi:alpha/beta fold hydrolase [Halobacillus litoralis]|uniref:alpha/beta fold hydrolase n=1 Tax=Halobacillus litoralis TaxID=45668 RepID=UPI001CFC47BB|nr:alpha/beta hydrolase [Halobacillus litoralis]
MIGFILLGFIGLLGLAFATSAVHHKIRLAKEKGSFIPIGQIVDVDGHNMHVYQEGHGKETLVFMSGNGTSSPVLDFKSLFSQVSDQYKVVVVEKQGYGFSDITDSPRDMQTMLSQTRKALAEAGLQGPFILVPHSASGLEALYWAQNYPEEVRAVIGLDIAVPASYQDFKINIPLFRFASFLADMGITR